MSRIQFCSIKGESMPEKEEIKTVFSEKDKRVLEAGLGEWYVKVNEITQKKRVTHDPKSTSHILHIAIY